MSADPKRVQHLFLAAAALPAEDRKAFLDDECADPELRRRVDALLAAHDEPDSFLTQPALAPIADTGTFAEPELAPTVPHLDPPDRVGEVIAGRYKLLEPIGEGGMGSVWMAEQREPVRRLVAIKLIKAGMDSKTVLARFEAERQALAMMDHPNIAKVLDGGTTSDGRPYFVMELVKGVPITKYCDAAKLTPRERLELFVPVCQAIQHAHQKGIIHRDIKPTNVLIALYDGKPVPKVIDFGIAKATGQALTDRTLHTGFGAVVGTPEYMAPEQAEFNQLDVDTRSDIYSLGVLLYELLTGSTPFDRTRLGKAAILEILRIVREEEPPKPSTKLSTAGALASIAANRRTEPRKLTALIKGELDWIVMKCLEKDRGRRYDTANGLAADVQRYLADEPVQARAPSAGYRMRKFLRRNRVVVVVAGIIWLVTLMQVGFSTLQWLKASDERDVAQRERETANQERMEANRQRQVAVAAGVEARNAQQAAQEAQHQEFVARQQAEQDRDAKNAALVRSDGLRLGSEASLIRTSNPALSLLLGLEAVKRYPHPLTYTALYGAATELREVRSIHNDGVTINLLRLSDDGSRLLTAHYGGGSQTASVYDVASGKRVGGWHGFSHRLDDVNWSPDGKRAVAATSGRAMVTYTDGRKPERATFTERVAYVWDTETGKNVLHLKGHADKVVSARYSPDGTKILTASWDRTARLWDAKTGKELHVLRGHKQALLGATMSADGRWVVTVSAHHNNTAGYLDNKGQPRPEPRTEDGELDPGVTDRPFQSNGHSSGYSGSGFMEDEQPFARVWDAATGKQVAVLEIKRGSFDFLSSSSRWRQSPTYAAFSPDGKRIALGFEDGTVRLWDTETGGATPITLTGHKQRVLTMAFRADGKRLISAGSEDAMIVWNLETNRGERWLRGHQATSIHTVRYSADGSKILSAAADKTVRVWDADAEVGNERAVYRGHASQIAGAELLPDGNTIVSAGDGVRFWSIAPPAPVAVELRAKAPVTGLGQFFGADRSEHSAEVTALAFSPDGKSLVTGSQDRTVRLWDVATGRHLKGVSEQQVRGQVQSVAFTPDGKALYFGTMLNSLTMQRPTDKETALSLVHRWDLETNRATRHLKNFSRVVSHLALSRDGKRLLVVAGSDGLQFNQDGYVTWGYSSNRFPNAASTWDAATGSSLAAIEGQRGRSDGPPPQLSPDGKLILLGEANEQGSKVSLALFDAETGKRVRTLADLPPHGGSSNRWTTFVFSPDGQTIAARHPGRPFVWFWSAATGELLGSFESKASSQSWNTQRLVFSPDSKRIATTIDRTVVLVDVATRTELRQLRGHEERITVLAFAPDGSRLLTGSEDGSAILWDVATGVIQTVYKGHAGPVQLVAYSPDGTRVATASTESFVRVWAVNLMPEFERRKPRELTTVERQRYELSEQSRK